MLNNYLCRSFWFLVCITNISNCKSSQPPLGVTEKCVQFRTLHVVLLITQCVYKTVLITYKTLKTEQPVYLRDLLHYHQPVRTLRLESTTTLSAIDKDQFPIQAIQYHGTSCLERKVLLPTITTFKAYLKTELFSAAYNMV